MIQRLLPLVLCASGLLAGSASARTFGLPLEKPVAFITIPGSWKPKETKRGVEATSMDSAVYILADVVDSEKEVAPRQQEIFKMLHERKVAFDEKRFEKNDYANKGLSGIGKYYTGEDLEGKANVEVITVPVKDKFIIVTTWLSENEGLPDNEALTKMVSSLVSVDGVPVEPQAPAAQEAPRLTRSSSKK